MDSVLLAGAFGQGNPGDDALLESFLHELRGHDVVVTSGNPPATADGFGCRAIGSWDLAALAREVAASTAVVLGGGTVFKPLHPSTGRAPTDLLRRGLLLVAGARALAKPVAMVGVGAAPVHGSGRILARAMARRADLLVLRDDESARLLLDLGVPGPIRVGADPTWPLLQAQRGELRACAKAAMGGRDAPIVVALSHLAGGDDLADYLARALAPVARLMPVVLQPWQRGPGPGRDDDLAVAVASRVRRKTSVLPAPESLADAADTYASCALVVGLRFHALVAAAWSGCRFLAFGHEPKLTALARRLAQRVSAPVDGPEHLGRAILEAVDGPPPSPGGTAAELASAAIQFRMLRVLLSRGRCGEADDAGGLALVPAPWEDW